MVVVLIHFAVKADVDIFREAEFTSLCEIACANAAKCGCCRLLGGDQSDPDFSKEALTMFRSNASPLLFATFCNVATASRAVERAVLVKAMLLPFRSGSSTFPKLVEDLVSAPARRAPFEDPHPHLAAHSFKYEIEGIGRKIPGDEKATIIDGLRGIPHAGKVNITDPDATVFRVVLVHDTERRLLCVHHGMLLAESKRTFYLDHFSLKSRRYIGTTSMPPELTFLMANLARVAKGHLVVDPFAGTGATLISASALGAATMGFDMDGRVLRDGAIVGPQAQQGLQERIARRNQLQVKLGKQVPDAQPTATFRQNFQDYLIPTADAARLNFSVACRAFGPAILRLKNAGFLDAIVSDPPYGIREQQRKVVDPKEEGQNLELRKIAPWACGDLMLDLIGFAAVSLVTGGFLVYWHPTSRLTYTDAEIPRHPCFDVVCNEEQALSIKIGRRLVVMRKTRNTTDPVGDMQLTRANLVEPADVRKMMDDTTTGNEEYFAYRSKREAIRQSRKEWQEQNAQFGKVKPSKREANIENRARNVQEREARQRENDERQKRESDPKRSRSEGGSPDV